MLVRTTRHDYTENNPYYLQHRDCQSLRPHNILRRKQYILCRRNEWAGIKEALPLTCVRARPCYVISQLPLYPVSKRMNLSTIFHELPLERQS